MAQRVKPQPATSFMCTGSIPGAPVLIQPLLTHLEKHLKKDQVFEAPASMWEKRMEVLIPGLNPQPGALQPSGK